MSEQTKFVLGDDAIPTHWVNLLPDLPGDPLPPLNPGTGELASPDPVRDAYALWRPTPLYRARRLEQELGTPAKIFYKYEGVSPAGSHKPNSAVPQAYENAQRSEEHTSELQSH